MQKKAALMSKTKQKGLFNKRKYDEGLFEAEERKRLKTLDVEGTVINLICKYTSRLGHR